MLPCLLDVASELACCIWSCNGVVPPWFMESRFSMIHEVPICQNQQRQLAWSDACFVGSYGRKCRWEAPGKTAESCSKHIAHMLPPCPLEIQILCCSRITGWHLGVLQKRYWGTLPKFSSVTSCIHRYSLFGLTIDAQMLMLNLQPLEDGAKFATCWWAKPDMLSYVW